MPQRQGIVLKSNEFNFRTVYYVNVTDLPYDKLIYDFYITLLNDF